MRTSSSPRHSLSPECSDQFLNFKVHINVTSANERVGEARRCRMREEGKKHSSFPSVTKNVKPAGPHQSGSCSCSCSSSCSCSCSTHARAQHPDDPLGGAHRGGQGSGRRERPRSRAGRRRGGVGRRRVAAALTAAPRKVSSGAGHVCCIHGNSSHRRRRTGAIRARKQRVPGPGRGRRPASALACVLERAAGGQQARDGVDDALGGLCGAWRG